MKTVSFTEFRSRASSLLDDVEKGETVRILRHGRPVAELGPLPGTASVQPSWKRPGLKLTARGASLTAAILSERRRS